MEIRDALTLEFLSTLQSTKATTRFRRGLAYSPDGRSLAACSDVAVVIWDTQTGGEVTRLECEVTGYGLELVWSLDGKAIGTLSPRVLGTHTIRTYGVASRTMLSSSAVQSTGGAHIWAHDKSFRVATTAEGRKGWTITIFEVGRTITRIESFPFQSHFSFEVFSPATHRICASVSGNRDRDPEFLILDVRNSNVLLRETNTYSQLAFSHDGNLFAASTREHLRVWRYTSGHYTQWREFRQTLTRLQFSPASSSILGDTGVLHVLRLDYSPAAVTAKTATATRSRPQDAFSPGGTYVATAYHGESTVTITDLRPQNPSPSQFIDTDLEISAMVLTGNVLLVKASDTVAAWLLTENGAVEGVLGNTRAGRSDSLWDVSSRDTSRQNMASRGKPPGFWAGLLQWEHENRDGDDDGCDLVFSVADGIGAVGRHHGYAMCTYNTGTGEILKSVEAPLHPRRYRFHHPHGQDECDLYHRESGKHRGPVESIWPVSQTSLREGWVKDPEGKHRLWLHARWRSSKHDVDWLFNVTTLRLRTPSELVIVKF